MPAMTKDRQLGMYVMKQISNEVQLKRCIYRLVTGQGVTCALMCTTRPCEL